MAIKGVHRLVAVVVLGLIIGCSGYAHALTALDEGAKISEISHGFAMMSMTPSVSDYLDDPKTTCTMFITDNKGFEASIEKLGPHIGQITSNETLVELMFNYAVIPGKAMKLNEFKDGEYMTRAKEALSVLNYKNQTYVYSNTKFPILVKKANQKVGKCILHIIAEPVRPPSMLPMMHEWYAEYVAEHPEAAKADAERAKLVAQAQAEKAKAAGLPVPKANATAAAAATSAAPAASNAGNTTAASPAPNSAAGVQTAAGLLLGAAAMVAML